MKSTTKDGSCGNEDPASRAASSATKSAAKRNGVSLNKELSARVEQSFAKDAAFGGSDFRHVAMHMASAFALNGSRKAEEKSLDRWTGDPNSTCRSARRN